MATRPSRGHLRWGRVLGALIIVGGIAAGIIIYATR
jgi:hypothetical protein